MQGGNMGFGSQRVDESRAQAVHALTGDGGQKLHILFASGTVFNHLPGLVIQLINLVPDLDLWRVLGHTKAV